jgi:hypothetical protein
MDLSVDGFAVASTLEIRLHSQAGSGVRASSKRPVILMSRDANIIKAGSMP